MLFNVCVTAKQENCRKFRTIINNNILELHTEKR